MAEYIKREDVLAKVQSVSFEYYDRFSGDVISHEKVKAVLEKDILKIPAADVRPVVYCKECKHRPVEECRRIIAPKYADGYTDYKCPFLCSDPWYNRMPADDDYCSSGEKREES